MKNTGRCKELLVPLAQVYLQPSDNPQRKTAYSLIAVEKGKLLINMDAQAPNQVVAQGLREGKIILPGFEKEQMHIRPEKVHGSSRFDFLVEQGEQKAFIEVKGVTLEEEGVVRFPDAPTLRGVKHMEGLIEAVEEGYHGFLIFVVQMSPVTYFAPNDKTHPQFGDTLRKAAEMGVKILAYDCMVEKDSLEIGSPVCVKLSEK